MYQHKLITFFIHVLETIKHIIPNPINVPTFYQNIRFDE